jgi:glycosyltransferase involved in cell wall biosynthesis
LGRAANIVGWDNGGGLSRDIDILSRALLDLGWTVSVNGRLSREKAKAVVLRALRRVRRRVNTVAVSRGIFRPPFELNLHLEEISKEFLPLAERNVLIPNQEWFRQSSLPLLKEIDCVWVKTHLAERLFADLGCQVQFLGWTSADRKMTSSSVLRSLSGLHIAGANMWKGTETVLDVWSQHAEWPQLTVLRRTHGYEGRLLPWLKREPRPNIRIVSGRVDDESLKRMQNESIIHVCPSEAEGFGHVIVESMSVGAVVITTNAPPMNEIVSNGIGLLAEPEQSEPMSLGRRYFVDRDDLAKNIIAALSMSEQQRNAMGQSARAWFDSNGKAFCARLDRCMESPVP